MIKIENFAGPSSDQWKTVILGIRNPMNSWIKSDSFWHSEGAPVKKENLVEGYPYCRMCTNFDKEILNILGDDTGCFEDTIENPGFVIGPMDLMLIKNLIAGGEPHPKFLRQLSVVMDITAPLYWWKQMDQYKIGTVTDSCSTMHRLTHKEFEASDFSAADLTQLNSTEVNLDVPIYKEPFFIVLDALNYYRDKYLSTGDRIYWNKINELLPQSYNQKRTWSANYSVLFNICRQRFNHKLSEWQDFVKWIIDYAPLFAELCLDKLCEDEKFLKWYAEEYNLEITETVVEKKVYSLVEGDLNG